MSDLLKNLDTGIARLAEQRVARTTQDLRNAESSSKGKIEKAAEDFESILVGQWLEQAEKSFASVPGVDPDEEQDSTHDQFLTIACQELARGLSHTGAFGISQMIRQRLEVATNEAAKSKLQK